MTNKEKVSLGFVGIVLFVLIGIFRISETDNEREKFQKRLSKDHLVHEDCVVSNAKARKGHRASLRIDLNFTCDIGNFTYSFMPKDYNELIQDGLGSYLGQSLKISYYQKEKCIKRIICPSLKIHKEYSIIDNDRTCVLFNELKRGWL